MPSWTKQQLHEYLRKFSDKAHTQLQDAKQCQCPIALESDSKGEAQSTRCPHVRFTLCRVKLLDVDAKYHSCKDLIDGLQHAGLISGDREGEITLEVNQVKVAHYEDEQTVVEITPLTNEI